MDRDTLRRLGLLNQLSLTEQEKDELIEFFADREEDLKALEKINTENTERMVHVMPILTVVREDIAIQKFDRDALQAGAPETDEGYWCVPKVVE
ncbi:MAG: Asp-tRNA(Asn)/Glu-tRNA(Gln) amidotransferase subunit GatC [Clostridia bacterium]|jgi:aspartyl-tRNA(Asn)/glutamyl-tRNA(Gln) amidotransferase subunit C|nr:Asp-tRNA(Asn)/Glu-tRNA(Gln) amidotransferase subunit GatC [Clostridia bacterium]